MQVQASTADPLQTGADTVAIGVFDGEDASNEALRELVRAGEARPALGHVAVGHADGRRLIAVGLGSRAEFDPEAGRVAAARVHARAVEIGAEVLCFVAPGGADDLIIEAIVQGTLLHAYRFERYKPAQTDGRLTRLVLAARQDFSAPVHDAAIVTAAQNRARDLGNTPGNDLPPSALAAYAQELGARHGFGVTVLDEHTIRETGMGAFAAVAQGSEQDAQLIRLEYEGASGPRLGLVGKAVTFDSGGLSLKPAAKMHEMKFDMCGGAAVIEAIAALAELGAPVHVLGIVGATENLPSGSAVKPGDIVRALDGTTIEINNTDAEGRLVLADCLCYARREGCERLVDIATLTGGIVVALGSTYAGMMANDDSWATSLLDSARRSGELLWRMPLHRGYAEMIKGRYAELTNLTDRREASPITGAELLHHFAGDVPWAHLDIAGTAYDVSLPYIDKGATGFGVRLLVDLARSLGPENGSAEPPSPRM
ncbi:MAG: leucyl aminopeptidase [Actinomycetota bacterium]|nr:leucyl aminopeptidase [Actinomycetota bacterium]